MTSFCYNSLFSRKSYFTFVFRGFTNHCVIQWHERCYNCKSVDALWPAQVTDGLKYNGQPLVLPNKFNSKKECKEKRGRGKCKRMRQLLQIGSNQGAGFLFFQDPLCRWSIILTSAPSYSVSSGFDLRFDNFEHGNERKRFKSSSDSSFSCVHDWILNSHHIPWEIIIIASKCEEQLKTLS